jgi:hypothetical protein
MDHYHPSQMVVHTTVSGAIFLERILTNIAYMIMATSSTNDQYV